MLGRSLALWSRPAIIKGSLGAVPVLRELLHDGHWQVRFYAVDGLASVGTDGGDVEAAVSSLAAALSDDDGRVRWLAFTTLRRLRPQSEPDRSVLILALSKATQSQDETIKCEALLALSAIDPEAAKEAGIN